MNIITYHHCLRFDKDINLKTQKNFDNITIYNLLKQFIIIINKNIFNVLGS